MQELTNAGWKFGERYNESGEFNPRLIVCGDCGDYGEPETMTFWNLDSQEGAEYWCATCANRYNLTFK